MADLDAVHPLLDECRDALAGARVGRMREDREASRTMNQHDGVRDRQPLLGDVRRTSVTQIPIERITKVDGPSFGDHRPRDVRPTDRPTSRLLEN